MIFIVMIPSKSEREFISLDKCFDYLNTFASPRLDLIGHPMMLPEYTILQSGENETVVIDFHSYGVR